MPLSRMVIEDIDEQPMELPQRVEPAAQQAA
jgi:hypothetical protein